MKRLLIFLLAGLLAGLGGGTGLALLRAPRAADSTATAGTDSAARADVPTRVVPAPHAPAPTTAAAHPDSAARPESLPRVAADTGAAATSVMQAAPTNAAPTPGRAASPPTDPPADAEADSAARSARVKRIAKVFASMAPRDAARVLQQLDDHDVELILGSLASQQAADVLSNFPAERAAVVSARLLRGGGGGRP